MSLERIAEISRTIGCDVVENARMEDFTSFRIGGPADLLITAKTPDMVRRVRQACAEFNLPLLFIGNGTNLLVSDKGVRGVVLRLDGEGKTPVIKDGLVLCEAGISLKTLCRFARDSGLSGLEFAYGIPGTVGGAVYMNAGAFDGWISDVIEWAEAVFENGETKRLSRDEMKFGYRKSVFMDSPAIVVSAAFRLKPGNPAGISERMEEYLRTRKEKQPLEFPSAGSFFKRPEGNFAGALIENCGLRGCRVGGAQISQKHCGFIINLGGATCSDVKALADKVIKTVYRNHGIKLEPEVCFVGEE